MIRDLKFLFNRLPEATGIFRLASKRRKFHVRAGVRVWWSLLLKPV